MNFDAFLPPFSRAARRVSGGTSWIHQMIGPCAPAFAKATAGRHAQGDNEKCMTASGQVKRRGGVLAALALLAGCASPGPLDPVFTGPYFTPVNHAGDPGLGGLRRVVLLPVWAGVAVSPETLAALDPVVVSALQRENRFEVVTFSRAESLRRFRTAGFSSTSALPHGLLEALREAFAADGVLFVDVTVFSPYRPLALGLRARLATIDGSRIVWTFDTVFSAEDPTVVNAARRHVLASDGAGMPTDLSRGVLQSPGRFAGYAAAAMFATLPPVLPPVAATRGARR